MGPKKQKKKDDSRNNKEKCWYFNRGYCRNRDSCQEFHPEQVCSKPNCFEEDCPQRHPNPCKFGKRCKYNRQQICLYAHEVFENDDARNESEKRLQKLEKENETLKKAFGDFIGKSEKMFEKCEKRIELLKKDVESKDSQIGILEINFTNFETSFGENSTF